MEAGRINPDLWRGVDPVCGMQVDPDHPKGGTYEWEGGRFGFCNPRCREKFAAAPEAYLFTRDPVCGMNVPWRGSAGGSLQRGSQTYAFCSDRCRQQFEASPPLLPAAESAEYTCPMHPEVRQLGPGSCPLCGMALEPVDVTASEENPELRDLRWRLWLGVLFTVPLLALAMGPMLPGLQLFHAVPEQVRNIAQLLLATPVVWVSGWVFLQRAYQSVQLRSPNMFTLIGLGVMAAWGYSVVAALFPSVLPEQALADGHVPVYFEAAAAIVVLVLAGQVLELRARQRTGAAVRALLSLVPPSAVRIEADGSEHAVPVAVLRPGDRVRVRAGESIPVDGVVVEGQSAVNESLLTGESMPVTKAPGDPVTAGTINTNGSIIMRAERVGADTVLAQMIRLVQEAQRSRVPMQRLVDRVAAVFVIAVVVVAAATFVAWLVWGPPPQLAYALVNSVAVLIIACPCALGLATPMSVMVATGRAAQLGILVRDAQALERMEQVTVVLVDKTGTITEGRPEVLRVRLLEGFTEPEVLRMAASLEQASSHPLAGAILRKAESYHLPLAPPSQVEEFPGSGVAGTVEGAQVVVGTVPLLRHLGIPASETLWESSEELRRAGYTVAVVALGGRPAALLAIADPIRPSAREAVAALRKDGVLVVMVTGDNPYVAQAVAEQVGIIAWLCEVKPEDKADWVRRYRDQHKIVAMVGDGINDAPALATAHVGIAVASGTDIAKVTAAVTLLRSDLRGVVRLRELSKATMRNIRQNLFLAFGYNALAIPIAAGVLYPDFGLLLNPMIAAAAMSLSSVSVVSNALRLQRVRLSFRRG